MKAHVYSLNDCFLINAFKILKTFTKTSIAGNLASWLTILAYVSYLANMLSDENF